MINFPSASVTISNNCDAGALEPAAYIDCVLNKMLNFAYSISNSSIDLAKSAVSEVEGADWSISRNEDPFSMTAQEPDIPEIDNAVSVYEEQRDYLIPLFEDLYNKFITSGNNIVFNPARDAAGEWLERVILNGDASIPAALENQIWGNERDRQLISAASARNTTLNNVAAKGWILPPGSLLAVTGNIDSAALRSIGDASVAVATKRFDTQIESTRFAVEQALKVYGDVLSAGTGYLNALIDALKASLDVAEVDPNVHANLVNAYSNLYGKRIQKDTVMSDSLSQFYDRLWKDGELRNDTELRKLGLNVDARKFAGDVGARLGMAGLSQFSGILSQTVAG